VVVKMHVRHEPLLRWVRQREQGVAHYRPPREKLTIVG
jgi:hypothetical protein